MTASLFWGFYESAQIWFVENYLNAGLNVIELGSNIGVVSSHIASKLGSGKKFITVEANPFLIVTIKENIGRHVNDQSSFEVINCAVGYDVEKEMISITNNNTETRVVKNDTGNKSVAVNTITFADLVAKNGNEDYVLVCDIEGSEIEILLREDEALKRMPPIVY